MSNFLAGAALVVAILAVPVTIWATRKWGTRRAGIAVAVDSTPLLPNDSFGLLQVTFRDIAVHQPHLVTVLLQNTGPRDVSTDMFDSGRPIVVRFDQTFYGVTNPEGGIRLVAPPVGSSGDQAVVMVEPGLLKRGEHWSFSAVTTGPVEVAVDAPLIDTDLTVGPLVEDGADITLRLSALGIPIEVEIPWRRPGGPEKKRGGNSS